MDVWALFGTILILALLAGLVIVILSLAISLSASVIRAGFKPTPRRDRITEDVEEYDPFEDVIPSKDDPRG